MLVSENFDLINYRQKTIKIFAILKTLNLLKINSTSAILVIVIQ